MNFKFGDLFLRKIINEPFLALTDQRWAQLEGGYRKVIYDASKALRQLETLDNNKDAQGIYDELWDNLHHQGDVGIASYYALPHLIRIAKEKNMVDYNVLGLTSLIEIQRHKSNPAIPEALYPAYSKALAELPGLAISALAENWDLSMTSAALTAIAIGKGEVKLANAIQNLDDDSVIDEFLEQH